MRAAKIIHSLYTIPIRGSSNTWRVKSGGRFQLRKRPHWRSDDKPNSVSDDHLSRAACAARPPHTSGVMRLLPGSQRAGGPTPCFVLHRMGFFVPRSLRAGRWALTPPFHPYPRLREGGLFSVTLSVARDFRRGRPHVLCGMLPCGVRTFLSPGSRWDSDHLSFRSQCSMSRGFWKRDLVWQPGKISFRYCIVREIKS